MSVALDAYNSVHTSLFVRIDIDEYKSNPALGYYVNEVLTFSDHFEPYTLDGETYYNLGRLLNVTQSRSEIRPSGSSVSISISGIPNSSIAEIVNSKIKGSPVKIYRGYFNVSTGNIIGTLQGRFRGFINNYSLQEEYDVDTRIASNTILLECASAIDVLSNKYSGRRTNPESEKKYFSTDVSMDRVPNLENATFDFGAPK